MSFTEIIIIAVVAILVLGPEKLPSTLVELAKLIKAVKKQINEAKTSIENEINISELKDEARRYKEEITKANANIRKKLSFDELSEVGQEIATINEQMSDFAKAANEALNDTLDTARDKFNDATSDKPLEAAVDKTVDNDDIAKDGKRAKWRAEQAKLSPEASVNDKAIMSAQTPEASGAAMSDNSNEASSGDKAIKQDSLAKDLGNV